jgi:RNA polymerase sigma factor (sigma-70 family)
MSREQLFVSELTLIERVIGWVCARRGLRGADAEDFASTAKLRLIEKDYEVLGRFEGRSSLKTYLTAVITRLYLDYQAQRFGKWRPSAEARRLGPVALRLESLLYRDRLTFEEAYGVMKTEARATMSREELHGLSLRLPPRVSRRPVAGDDEASPPAAAAVPSLLDQAERQVLAERTFHALRRALARLPARDRIVLRLHVETGLSIADVARALAEDQKALYRRRDAVLERLRRELEADGVQCHDAHALLSTLDWDSAPVPAAESDPSPHERAGGAPAVRTPAEGEP